MRLDECGAESAMTTSGVVNMMAEAVASWMRGSAAMNTKLETNRALLTKSVESVRYALDPGRHARTTRASCRTAPSSASSEMPA